MQDTNTSINDTSTNDPNATLADHLVIRQLATMDYSQVWHAMQKFTDNRDDTTLDEIWLVEHPPVFTQGQAGKAEHLLMPGDIEVVKVDQNQRCRSCSGCAVAHAFQMVDHGVSTAESGQRIQ